jgi:hypothetical protein
MNIITRQVGYMEPNQLHQIYVANVKKEKV